MKSVLITGAGSYIGESFRRYLERWPQNYAVSVLDMRGNGWEQQDFSAFDSVLHVAAIVHAKRGKYSAAAYQSINVELPCRVAAHAKAAGVGQFIFLSSMAVYGTPPGGLITRAVPEAPKGPYALSKFQAELGLSQLAGTGFSVCVVRPPMVYGPGCRGNYARLSRLAQKTPAFCGVQNQRSMLYIQNLCEFLRQMVDGGGGGLFFPQNAEYVCTAELVRQIAKAHGKQVRTVRAFDWLIQLLLSCGMLQKPFGNLRYDMQLSQYASEYRVAGFVESVVQTESGA